MTLAIKIVLVVVLLLILVGVGLRVRKLRRDEQRERFQKIDRRLLAPPPSPYTPSKGFRLLDGEVPVTRRPEPARPRLEQSREYVFSDSQLSPLDEAALAESRRDARWALSRSAHRSRIAVSGARVVIIAIVIVAIVIIVGYFLQHHSPTSRAATSTTSTTSTTLTTTTTAWPSSFAATSTGAKSAAYSVPANRYRVDVHAVAGAEWTVYRMGPKNTLEFQGQVAQGQHESLVLTGVAQVTLGSPSNATVSVGGSPVALPSPLSSPLTLFFTPSTTAAG